MVDQPLAPEMPKVQEQQTPQGPVALPIEQAEQAILSGKYQIPAGKTVTVVDTSGAAFDLPSEHVKDAIEQGYKLETPQQGAIREYVKANDNVLGDAKVAALQAANQLLLDIPQTVYEHTANPFEVKKWEALKESHDIANAAGGIGGFAGSLFIGGPLFKGAAKAGTIAAEMLAGKLAAAGIERGSKSIAKDLLARTLTNAAKMGTEGVVISAPRAVTEAALGDPNAAAESLMMGGGLGAAFGTVAGPTGKLLEKLNLFQSKAESAGEKLFTDNAFKNSIGEKTVPNVEIPSTGKLVDDMRALGANEKYITQIEQGMNTSKSEIADRVAAAETLGLPVVPEFLSADKGVKDAVSALSQRTDTVIGSTWSKRFQERFDRYSDYAKGLLNYGSEDTSLARVGSKIKDDLMTSAESAIKPVSDLFNALEVDYNQIPVSQQGLNQIAMNIENLQGVKQSIGDSRGLADRVIEHLTSGKVQNISDLKAFRTGFMRSLKATASPSEKAVMREISQKLLNHEESSIDRYALAMLKKTPNAGEATLQRQMELGGLFNEMKDARKQWRDLIENFNDDLQDLNGKTINSPSDFINEVRDLTPEQVAKRFAPKNDSEALSRLMAKYPEKVQSVLNLEKSRILDKSMRDGVINPRTFINEIAKLTPEYQNALFGEKGMQIARAIERDFEGLPANINPPGTAKTIGITESLLGGGINHAPYQLMKNVQASVEQAKIRASVSVEGVLGAEKSLLQARSKLEQIGTILNDLKAGGGKAAKAISEIGAEKPIATILRLVGDDNKGGKEEAFTRLQKKMAEVSANPQGYAANLAQKTSGLARAGAPQVAQAYQQKIVNTLGYIQQAMPKRRTIVSPFYNPPYRPGSAELAAFERKLSVIEDPSIVIRALGNGTLTHDHIDALAANYPLFYQAMKSKILDHVSEHGGEMPYQNRLKMGLLLGVTIDPTTEPQNVQAFQSSYQTLNQGPQKNDGLKASGLERLNPGEQYATPTQKAMAKDYTK